MLVQAPGRVNLIGEHTDYNGGHALPMATGYAIGVAARRRVGAHHRALSLNYQEETSVLPGGGPEATPHGRWSAYVAGMLQEMERAGRRLRPLSLHICGDIPSGAGLSSSAALCVATGMVVDAIASGCSTPVGMALRAQRVEHEWAKVRCGIMDPLACLLARPGHALLLDCGRLKWHHVPVKLGEVEFVLIDSGVRRKLGATGYNERRQECADALRCLQQSRPKLRHLCDASESDLPDLGGGMHWMRAAHVVRENVRVLAAARALEKCEWEVLGRLMVQSHRSLRDLYQVSCPELDCLVDAALEVPGVLGARMTGGGFGGCTINLVASSAVERLCIEVAERYREVFGCEARTMVLGASLQAGRVAPIPGESFHDLPHGS